MAIARVQAAGSGTIAVSQTTAPVAMAGVGVGHGLIVACSIHTASAVTVSGVSDGANTYSQVAGAFQTDGSFEIADLWICKNVTTGGSLTVTPTFTVTGGPACTVIEVSGQDTVTFIDQVISAHANSTAPNSTATPATSVANEFVVGFIGITGASAVTAPLFSTALTSQTVETRSNATATSLLTGCNVVDGLLAASGVAETFSATASLNHWVAICATFLPAAGTVISGADTAAVVEAALPSLRPGDSAAVVEGISGLALGRGDAMAVVDRAAIALSAADTTAVVDLGVSSQGPAGFDSGAIVEATSIAFAAADAGGVADHASITATLTAANTASVADAGVVAFNAPVAIGGADAAVVLDAASVVATAGPPVPVRLTTRVIPGVRLSTSVNPGP